MTNILSTVQLISGLALIVLILIQPRGKGFGRGLNSNSFTRRGVEKLVFQLTFIVAFVFVATSVAALFF